jgi:hypothetical protein
MRPLAGLKRRALPPPFHRRAWLLGSRLLGLRTVVIAHQFGASPDSMPTSSRSGSDLIFQLLAGATLGSAFIPTFARIAAGRGEHEAWALASSVLNLLLAATLVCAVVGLLIARPVPRAGLGDGTAEVGDASRRPDADHDALADPLRGERHVHGHPSTRSTTSWRRPAMFCRGSSSAR